MDMLIRYLITFLIAGALGGVVIFGYLFVRSIFYSQPTVAEQFCEDLDATLMESCDVVGSTSQNESESDTVVARVVSSLRYEFIHATSPGGREVVCLVFENRRPFGTADIHCNWQPLPATTDSID